MREGGTGERGRYKMREGGGGRERGERAERKEREEGRGGLDAGERER